MKARSWTLLIPLSLLLLTALLSACGGGSPLPGAAPTSTTTAAPLSTDTATTVAQPTMTIEPSATGTSSPSFTPITIAAQATSTPVEQIIYLDADGVTVKSINPDGSDVRTLAKIDKPHDATVSSLSADPSGDYLLYGLTKANSELWPDYFLLHKDASTKVGTFAGAPRWSPGGATFAAQAVDSSGAAGAIYLYDISRAEGKALTQAGRADWFPGGNGLVYVYQDNVYTYDIGSGKSTQVTKLPNNDTESWVVQEAHVLPDGKRILFFGGKFRENGQQMLGAQGNGQQWWVISAEGGNPQPWGEPEGNGIVAYETSPGGDALAYGGSAHSSACVTVQTVAVMSATQANKQPDFPKVAELDDAAERYAYVVGLAWSPGGKKLAFGLQPYTCPDAGASVILAAPIIYTWEQGGAGADAQPRKLASGSYPLWIK